MQMDLLTMQLAIEYDRRYRDVLSYVSGSTVVLTVGCSAVYRATSVVTLDGELLESSGAMTGGSSVAFGVYILAQESATESDESNTITKPAARDFADSRALQ